MRYLDWTILYNDVYLIPQISSAEPGRDVWLDYSKADLWTVGTLVYEIFGLDNPFSGGRAARHLDSRTYKEEDLPSLPGEELSRLNKS